MSQKLCNCDVMLAVWSVGEMSKFHVEVIWRVIHFERLGFQDVMTSKALYKEELVSNGQNSAKEYYFDIWETQRVWLIFRTLTEELGV